MLQLSEHAEAIFGRAVELDALAASGKPALEAMKLAKQGKDLSFQLAFGDQTVSFLVPEPSGPADQKSGKK